MIYDWLTALLWIWCGGTLPIMAGGALLDDGDMRGAVIAALLWPVFVGFVVWTCIDDGSE